MDTSDIRKGLKFMMDGNPYVVTDFQFVKPGKGQAFTRTKMRNMLNGGTIERNIRSGEKLEPADVEDRTLQFIYPEGDAYVFMNSQTGDQVTVQAEVVGEDAGFLTFPTGPDSAPVWAAGGDKLPPLAGRAVCPAGEACTDEFGAAAARFEVVR